MPKNKTQALTQTELEAYLEHYLYEVGMLNASFNALNMLISAQALDPQSNMIGILRLTSLESFLVHSRCLIEFFHSHEMERPRHKDKKTKKFDVNNVDQDYVAQHYIANWPDIRSKVQTKRNISKDRFIEISQQLSHLSRSRVSGFAYPHIDMHHDLMLLHKEFLENLPSNIKKETPKQ